MKKWIALAMLMVVALVCASSTNLVQADDDDKKKGSLDVLVMESYCDSYSSYVVTHLTFRFSSFTVGSQATTIINRYESGGPFDPRGCLDTLVPTLESIGQAAGCVTSRSNVYETIYQTRANVTLVCTGTKSELVQTIADEAEFLSTVQFP